MICPREPLTAKACAAVLSASFSGSSTATVAALAKRAGLACVRVFEEHYGAAPGAKEVVRGRLNREVPWDAHYPAPMTPPHSPRKFPTVVSPPADLRVERRPFPLPRSFGVPSAQYAEAAQELVWGSAAEDRVFATFFR